MRLKGGLLNGILATLYGFFALWLVFYKQGMEEHQTMQRISYVLAGAGILLAIYWLATREVTGIPFFLLGLNFLGMARYSEHLAMDVGAAAMGAVAMVAGLLMFMRIEPPERKVT